MQIRGYVIGFQDFPVETGVQQVCDEGEGGAIVVFSVNRRQVALLVVMLFGAHTALATVIVRFNPSNAEVQKGQQFQVQIVADIPSPVVGWGLDVAHSTSAISQVGSPAIGPAWSAAFAPDGDDLAGMAFPQSISGSGILLATLTFSADTLGGTDLIASITPGDLTEGFPLDPTGFADVTFQTGHIQVTPEPAMLGLILVGATALRSRPRRSS